MAKNDTITTTPAEVWVLKEDACKLIEAKGYGSSPRQVERLAARGLIAAKRQSIDGRSRPLYSEESIAKLPERSSVQLDGPGAAVATKPSLTNSDALAGLSSLLSLSYGRRMLLKAAPDQPEEAPPIYIGLMEAARLSGVARARIKEQAESRLIRAIRQQGRIRVHRDDLNAMQLFL